MRGGRLTKGFTRWRRLICWTHVTAGGFRGLWDVVSGSGQALQKLIIILVTGNVEKGESLSFIEREGDP